MLLLDKHGTYSSDQPGPKRTSPSPGETAIPSRRVFRSLPSDLTAEQQALVERFSNLLLEQGPVAEDFPRSEYPPSGQLSKVRRRISGCCGIVIFGFQKPGVEHVPLRGKAGSSPLPRLYAPTPWNHIEASMAFVLDLPLLVFSPVEFDQGVFDKTLSEQFMYQLPLEGDWSAAPAKAIFTDWASAVLEQAQRGR